MIPFPVSSNPPGLRARFYSRARLSNTGLLLVLSSLALSLCFNLLHYTRRPVLSLARPGLLATVTRDNIKKSLRHLIIVPGHAIWTGIDPNLRLAENEWLMEPYDSQKGRGRLAAFFTHISQGVQLAAHDKRSLLVFSGGQTKKASTTTEAESYLRLALRSNLFGASETPSTGYARTTTENYALDSYQNLLFSIARFHEYSGRFPDNITVVGYEFKRRRFVDLHRAAIRWPIDRFHYIGIDAQDESSRDAQQGELENGYKPYSSDMYGCHAFLASKRRQRNPHYRFHPYHSSTPELADLVDWCPGRVDDGPSRIFPETLPWDPL